MGVQVQCTRRRCRCLQEPVSSVRGISQDRLHPQPGSEPLVEAVPRRPGRTRTPGQLVSDQVSRHSHGFALQMMSLQMFVVHPVTEEAGVCLLAVSLTAYRSCVGPPVGSPGGRFPDRGSRHRVSGCTSCWRMPLIGWRSASGLPQPYLGYFQFPPPHHPSAAPNGLHRRFVEYGYMAPEKPLHVFARISATRRISRSCGGSTMNTYCTWIAIRPAHGFFAIDWRAGE